MSITFFTTAFLSDSASHFLQFRPKWGEKVKGTFPNELILLHFDTDNIVFVDRFCVLPYFQTFLDKTATVWKK